MMRSWKSIELQRNFGIKKAFRPERKQTQEYELLSASTYESGLNQHDVIYPPKLPPRPRQPLRPWRSLLTFTAQNTPMLVALFTGISGAFACFAFAYWLSRQLFECPSWAIQCKVGSSAHYFRERLGFVQGILSSFYGVCIAMIVYATYQFAETTLWPALVQHSFKPGGIDRYLSHARGSLPMFPLALWTARKPYQLGVVLTVGLASLLLQLASTVVGWTFTIVPVATVLHSEYATGGGMGFGFTQRNPPAPMPLEPSNAYVIYSAWSSNQANEVLPHLRDFIIDRTFLSEIGDFSAPAVEARKSINCYPEALEIKGAKVYYENPTFEVATHFQNTSSVYQNAKTALLRVQPGFLTVWVDKYRYINHTSSVTKLMFAALDSTIEDGHTQNLPESVKRDCLTYACTGYTCDRFDRPCHTVSSLACDVRIDLVDSLACSGECQKGSTNAPLTTLSDLVSTYYVTEWLAAQTSLMGPAILGAQPMFTSGKFKTPHSNYTLPIPYSDFNYYGGHTRHWTQANLTNFIDVSSGALATYIAQEFNQGKITLESRLDMPRLATRRTYAMLGPPGIALASVILVAILAGLMHARAGVPDIKLGWIYEILLAQDVQGIVEDIRNGRRPKADLEEIELRYGFDKERVEVLGPEEHVSAFGGP